MYRILLKYDLGIPGNQDPVFLNTRIDCQIKISSLKHAGQEVEYLIFLFRNSIQVFFF